jgi:uncharacterized protein (TIRG00374 family)
MARWAFGVLLIGLLLAHVRWQPIVQVLEGISPAWLAALLAFSFVLIWVSCLKWKLLLGKRRKSISVLRLMSLYMVGYFFSHFLPSQYGGDLVRSYELGKEIDSQAASFGSVFMERFTGFAALLLVSTVAGLLTPDLILRPEVGLPFAAAWAIFLGALLVLRNPTPLTRLAARFLKGRLARIPAAAESVHAEALTAVAHPETLVRVMLLSVLFHFLAVVNTWLAIQTIRGTVDFLPLMLVVPIILMVSTIPLTVNSIGLWEGAFVLFLAPLGLSGAQALSVALLLRAKGIVQAVLGGLVYLVRSRRR